MIKLIKSTFYNEKDTISKLIQFIKKARILSFSKECEKFEKNFSKWQGRKFCVFLNSGSSANLAITQVLLNLGKIEKGNYVGFSALTWSTNVMPLIQMGLQPVPVDIELSTLNISRKKLETVTKKYNIKILFITNLLGFCDDIDEIKKFCEEKEILLVEDNCESLGTMYKKVKLGNYGLAGTFSFYVGHHLSTIEGGAVCTDDEQVANMLKIVRAHGWDRNLSFASKKAIRTTFKIDSTFYSRYTFYDLGFNMRPTEITGFIGNTQLKYIDEIISKRKENFIKIAKSLYTLSDRFYPIEYRHIDLVSNFAFPLVCKSRKIRNAFVKKCKNNIEIRPIVGGAVSSQPFFKKHIERAGNFHCENAQLVHEQGFYFGNNPDLTSNEIERIIKFFSQDLL